jgi:C4-dicarboxylate transporter/malic acid transport protein
MARALEQDAYRGHALGTNAIMHSTTPLLHPDDDLWKVGHTHVTAAPRDFFNKSRITTFLDRLQHMTWAWFCTTMSTGGLALLLHSTPHRFHGLQTIGKVVYIFNLVLFVFISAGIGHRFFVRPGEVRKSLSHPTESLFFPTFLLSIATILSDAAIYGVPSCGPWLPTTLYVLFWIYAAVAVLSAIVQFYVLFRGQSIPIHSMTPAWILPIFPAMLTGTLAATISSSQSPERRLDLFVAGTTCQGLGWTIACLVYPLYLGRLMQDGLPAPAMRPAMFMAVGPPSFTAIAIIGMSRNIQEYGYFADDPAARTVLQTIALWTGIWIWCISFWFFSVSLLAVLEAAVKKQLAFSLSWWAFVFPNVGFAVSTGFIGQELNSPGIQWVSSGITICVVIMWFVVFFGLILAVGRKKLLWPKEHQA